MRITSLPISSLFLLCLTSCMNMGGINEYPSEWAKVDIENNNDQCPSISGFYKEIGENPSVKGNIYLHCSFLSYHLLSPLMTESVKAAGRDTDICSSVTFDDNPHLNELVVQLLQPTEDKLDIKIWGTYNSKESSKILYEETLSKKDGDFACRDGYLIPKKRTTYLITVAANYWVSENRNFSRTSDGWLVVKSDANGYGHAAIILMREKNVYWVRWEPFDELSL